MAIWICRAGKKAVYIDRFLEMNRIYCTWDGFAFDLTDYTNKEDLKKKIKEDNADVSSTAINTWAAQLLIFRDKMQIGDIILSPNENSKSYNIGIITGEYRFDKSAGEHFYHSHNIKWVHYSVSRDIFPQYMIYSLGAYRTIFNLKYEKEFFEIIDKNGIVI